MPSVATTTTPAIVKVFEPKNESQMNSLRLDLLVLTAVIAASAISGIYLFMLAIARNDDEHLHDSIGDPGHAKTRFLRGLARLRRLLSR
jgi:Mg-chelatase subunit ChlI